MTSQEIFKELNETYEKLFGMFSSLPQEVVGEISVMGCLISELESVIGGGL